MNQETLRLAANFDLGECFCDVRCRYGHATRLFNVGRNHYVACDTCRTYMFVGSNLMSSWRWENRETWQQNRESVGGYRLVQ